MPNPIAPILQPYREELITQYTRVFRTQMFTSRAELRPAEAMQVVGEEVAILLQETLSAEEAFARGQVLCQRGVSLQIITNLGRVTRQIILTGAEQSVGLSLLDIYDRYVNGVLEGYFQETEKLILSEQERIRGALQRAVGRYTIEIKEVQELAERANEANEFKSQFIARISHEVRTPLGGIVGMSEMLQHGIYGTLTADQKAILDRILNNAKNLNQLFSDLLAQAKIEAGQLHLNASPIVPKEIVESIYMNCLPLALQKGLALKTEIDPELPARILGDEIRLTQILSNLVINAIKYTHSGSVLVRVNKEPAQKWSLQVKDTGIGISPEAQAYIFEPYRQVEESFQGQESGIGLGLAIVSQLVSAMYGTITLQSRLGQGSTFTVRLPYQVVSVSERS